MEKFTLVDYYFNLGYEYQYNGENDLAIKDITESIELEKVISAVIKSIDLYSNLHFFN